ncbi:HNH endonuclease signature motif containing protein [Actinosynnema sp. NPDC020468]|uniref:HNH endonuclease n=1 Tax=Actinosynnema sp. NPDC020468 TaxID=3154488 RepID=UPI0033FC057B
MRARADQAAAHHIVLRADILGTLATDDPAVIAGTSNLLSALANTARRYWDDWDDQAHRAFGSARERARAAGHKARAVRAHAHAVPVDVPWLRRAHRDRCVYCGDRVEHIDHVWPLHLGGDDAPWNLAPACARCNLSKGARSLSDWWPAHLAVLADSERVRVEALWDSLRLA